jgi:putative ABC transport system permease protein
MDRLVQDLRFALRTLSKNPVFTAVVILTLAVGIGANSAIFSVINAVLLRPLPFGDPDRVVSVYETELARGRAHGTLSPANFLDLQSQNQVFSDIAAYLRGPIALTGQGDAAKLRAVSASPSLFSALAVSPFMGRAFLPEDALATRDKVVILSHELWSTRFGRDTDIVGKRIRLDGEGYLVIGVMPQGFRFPLSGSDVWVPLRLSDKMWSQRGAHFLSAVARLRPGVSEARMAADVNTIGARLEAQYPKFNKGVGIGATEFRNDLVGDVRPALLILFACVALVVLIACSNVANLLLVRANERDREVAVRTALGASPARLIRQLLTENILLCFLGASIGLGLASLAVKLILVFGPQDIPRIQSTRLDSRVLVFSFCIAMLTGMILSVLPALRAWRLDLHQSLKSGTRAAGDHEGKWLRSSLIVGELALSLLLLAGAGLLLRSFLRLQSVDPGFNPSGVLTFDLALPEAEYPDGARVAAFSNQLLERLQSLPGVVSAAVVSPRPLSGNDYSSSFKIKGQLAPPEGDEKSVEVRVVSRDYFRTMQIPVIRGRVFQASDRRDTLPVVVLSRSAEKKVFAGGEALGQQMTLDAHIGYDKVGGGIVGVVGDVHDFGLEIETPPDVYVLQDQAGVDSVSVLVRTQGDPTALATAARDQVREMDRNLPIATLSTMETALGESMAQRRFYMLLLALFAAIAIALATVGVYGVIAYSVSRRTQEIGIRLAIGAGYRQVLSLIMTQAAGLIGLGLLLGLIITAACSSILSGLLFGVRSGDPIILVSVTAGLGVIAFLASYIPARRVLRVDPMIALRYE